MIKNMNDGEEFLKKPRKKLYIIVSTIIIIGGLYFLVATGFIFTIIDNYFRAPEAAFAYTQDSYILNPSIATFEDIDCTNPDCKAVDHEA